MEEKHDSARERERELESRKKKRKELKKMKRKQKRKEMAEKERLEEEARLNDPEEQRKRLLMEQQEAERIERDRIAFEERERVWILNQQQQLLQQQQSQDQDDFNNTDNHNNDDQEEYEDDEEGLPEIIWQGNEIIVKKKKKKKKKTVKPNLLQHQEHEHDGNRPTSNPFPPESPSSAMPENVAQQIPNFGTEQDKAHCPFHLKTGACRFGQRCSRVHFYPDKSCTLLIKNMYIGPGLAWEQDEGLEQSLKNMDAYTDEEVECCFEEFYEDVHTEFLKFGEIVNFKVCKNGSFHLRGNVYVQYKLLDSAVLAYNSVNGRYFAGKQVSCNFVNLTRWKVAICGEFMKSRYKTCSHGTACNFIHCFRNPGGDYEWADSDKPPPKYWVKNMIALFGYSDDYDETLRKHGNSSVLKNFSNVPKTDSDRYHSRRSRSRETDQSSSGRSCRRKWKDERTERTPPDEEWNTDFKDNHKRKCRHRTPDTYSDGEKHHERSTRKSSFKMNKDNERRSHEEYSDVDWDTTTREDEKQHGREGRNSRKRNKDNMDRIYETGSDGDRHRKKHHNSQRKRSRHRSRDVCNVTDESDSDKDRTEMETKHDYSRKSTRHRRSRLQDYCKDSENENYKVNGELDSTHGNTKNVSHESCGELSRKNSRGDRHHKSKDSDNHL